MWSPAPRGFSAILAPKVHWFTSSQRVTGGRYKFYPTTPILVQILYSSAFNVLNLLACLVGAGLFGKISLLILLTLSSCTLAVVVSFFLDFEYQASYQNDTSVGFFKGISYNNMTGIKHLLDENWDSTYSMDCSNNLAEVFMHVRGLITKISR